MKKEAALRLISKSTAYGLANFFQSKRLSHKLLWLIFMLCAVSASIWYITGSISDYLNYEVITVIRTEYDQPTQFPCVSFCNYFQKYFDNKSLAVLIKKCSFGYDENIMSNLGNHFESFYSQDYGQCYRFNSGKNLSGHSIPILNSTIGGIDDAFSLYIVSKGGLAVWIHNQSQPPKLVNNNNHYANRLLVSEKLFVHMNIERTMETKLGLPFNNCFKNVSDFDRNKTIIDYIQSKEEHYSQEKCLELCFDLIYIEKRPCGCSNGGLGNIWVNCWILQENSNHSGCTWNFKKEFYKNSILKECSQYCPLECDSIFYYVESSSLAIEPNNLNTTKVKVNYRSLKYTLITEIEKYPLQDLISNVGGILGLFIGVSFVSLVEIIELFTEMIFLSIQTNSNKVAV